AAEETLAGIWTAVLKRERIGVHDNFFELGGDSISSIQVIARANQVGLHLSAKDLFQYQTIAELAAAVKTSPLRGEHASAADVPRELTPWESRISPDELEQLLSQIGAGEGENVP